MNNKSWSLNEPPGASWACNCIGPQRNEPYCPCIMRSKGIKNVNGRWIQPERDLGPVLDLEYIQSYSIESLKESARDTAKKMHEDGSFDRHKLKKRLFGNKK